METPRRLALSSPGLAATLVAVLAMLIAVWQSRWWERLLFPPHTLTWELSTDQETAFTGLRYDPLDRPQNGALYEVRSGKPVQVPQASFVLHLETRSRHRDVAKTGRVVVQAIVSPPPAGPAEIACASLSAKTARALRTATPVIDTDTLVEWDLHALAGKGWTRHSAPNAGNFLVSDASGARLSFAVPAAWAYVVMLGDPHGGAVQLRTEQGQYDLDLYRAAKGGEWIVQRVVAPGYLGPSREYSGTFAAVQRVHWIPLEATAPARGRLTAISVNGTHLLPAELATWPHGPDVISRRDNNGLEFRVQGPDAWIALPPEYTARSWRRMAVAITTGWLVYAGVGIAVLLLLWHLVRCGQWAPAGIGGNRYDGWIVLAVAVVLHGSLAALCPVIPQSDGEDYLATARDLGGYLANGSFRFYRTPVYPVLQRLALDLGGSERAIVLMQQILSCVMAWLVWRLGQLVGLGRWALVPALAVGLNPVLHWYGQTLLSETVTAFLVVAAACALVGSVHRRLLWVFGAGLVVGALVLCRPQFAYVVLLSVLLYLLLPKFSVRARLARSGVCLAGIALLLVPWLGYNRWRHVPGLSGATGYGLLMSQVMLHNEAVYECPPFRRAGAAWMHARGAKALGSTFVSGYLYKGTRRPRLDDAREQVRQLHDQINRNSDEMKMWARELYRRKPRTALRLILRTFAGFVGVQPARMLPNFRNLWTLSAGRTMPIEPTSLRARIHQALVWLYWPRSPYLFTGVLLGLVAALASRRTDWLLLAAFALGNVALISLIMNTNARYVLPTEPLAWVVAVAGVATVVEWLRGGGATGPARAQELWGAHPIPSGASAAPIPNRRTQ